MKKSCLLLALLALFTVACGDDDAPKAPNLVLASLTVSSGTLVPAFDPAVTAYTVSVSNTVDKITVTGIAAETNNTVSYDSAQPATLTVGSNLITVCVVSADHSETNSYRVVVLRGGSDNANLASLSVAGGTLFPAFDAAVTGYSLVSYVSNTVTDAVITAAADHAGASVSWPSGTSLTIGSNQLVVRVTAEDGTTMKDYTIRVYRMGADFTSPNIGILKFIPAGVFQRDANAANISYVSAFRMSRTEITRSQYSNIMGVDPSNSGYSSGISDPVQMVSWYHAITFCNKLSIEEGLTPVYTVSGVNFTNLIYNNIPVSLNINWHNAIANWDANGYRLPTEMERRWTVMAANMGTDPFAVNTAGRLIAFSGSDGSNSIGDYVWYSSNSGSKTHPVGSKLPNMLGLYDISGNVWEWTWDTTGSYPSGYLIDYPGPGSSAPGTTRWFRGGGWNSSTGFGLTAPVAREEFAPDTMIGFRVVRP